MIIDAHTHLFDCIHGQTRDGPTSDGGYGALRNGPGQIQVFPPFCENTRFTANNLLRCMDTAGVEKAVVLQGCAWGDQNEFVKQAVASGGGRLCAAMYAEPWDESAMVYIEGNHKSFSAVKLECSVETGFCGWRDKFTLANYTDFFKKMEALGIVLTLDLGAAGDESYQTDEVYDILYACPSLKIVICHLCQPRKLYLETGMLMEAWESQVSLARSGRVWFDTASLNAFFNDGRYPHDTAIYFFKKAIDIAGSSRIMFGTDLPGNTMYNTYRQMLDFPSAYAQEIGLSADDLENIYWRNAEHVYFGKGTA